MTSISFCSCSSSSSNVVIQFYNSHWLDKKCGTGRRLVVDHTRHLSSIFGFDRDTVSAVSHGDDGILQVSPCTVRLPVRKAEGGSGHLVTFILRHGSATQGAGLASSADLIFRKDTAADLRREPGVEKGIKSFKAYRPENHGRCHQHGPAVGIVGSLTRAVSNKVT